jgi:predicted RecA/RadA family phage recombinase
VIIDGEYVGVAVADAAIGEEVECQRTGVVELAKDAVEVLQGEVAYWDSGTASNVVAGDIIGTFHKKNLSGDSSALVLLKGGAASFN